MDISSAQQAEKLVEQTVFTGSKHDFVILKENTQQKKFGWVVFYTTREYLRTKNPSALVPGVGPIVVLRNGELKPLSTSVPPAQGIAIFEQNWLQEHGQGKPRP